MTHDIVRTVFTYSIAILVIGGGGVLLVVPTQLDQTTLLPFLTGAVGTVLGYVFGERTASTATQAAVQAQPTVTTTAGPPASMTLTHPDTSEPTTILTGTRGSELP